MKFLKSHFALSKSQQNGIFILVLLIIIFQVFLMFDFSSNKEILDADTKEIEAYRRQLDSLNRTSPKTKDSIFPFNPNYLTDFKAYQLGMKTTEIDKLLEFRKEGNWVNSEKDFQRVTGISDSLLRLIAPSFRFPEWIKKRDLQQTGNRIPVNSEIVTMDLNLASAQDLQVINGIGVILSERIVKYRSRIGGFLDPIQLKDVYGLTPEVISRIGLSFKLLSKPDITIRNINEISEAELATIPYFNEQISREILKYRRLHERIISFEELSKIDDFPYDKIDRIKLYLTLD